MQEGRGVSRGVGGVWGAQQQAAGARGGGREGKGGGWREGLGRRAVREVQDLERAWGGRQCRESPATCMFALHVGVHELQLLQHAAHAALGDLDANLLLLVLGLEAHDLQVAAAGDVSHDSCDAAPHTQQRTA